jgi:class 3 adenylate cyclase
LGRFSEARAVVLPPGEEPQSDFPISLRQAFRNLGIANDAPIEAEDWAAAHAFILERSRAAGAAASGQAIQAATAGLTEVALDALEISVDEVLPFTMHLGVTPHMDGLRGEPRFEALLEQIGWKAALAAEAVKEGEKASPAIPAGAVRKTAGMPTGTVTVMFTDIVGFTRLSERLGDVAAREFVRAHNALVREAVEAQGGHELEVLGDGFLLSFQGARPALHCAIEIQRSIAQRNTVAGEPLKVRIGLHTGEVLMDDDGPFGKTVIVASRIASKAQGEEILTSSLLHALTVSTGEHTFLGPRTLELKGITETQAVYAVDWRSQPTGSAHGGG